MHNEMSTCVDFASTAVVAYLPDGMTQSEMFRTNDV